MAEALLDDPMGDPAAVIDPLGDPAAVDPMGDPASVVDPLGDPAKPAANKPGLLTQVSAGETGAIADFLQAASRPSMVEQAVMPGTGLRKLVRPLLDPIANVFRGASESVEAPENLAGRLARGVGGILPAVGVSVVNPAAGVAVGALQGGGLELMAAQNAGATPLQQEVVQNLGTALGAVETFIPAGKLAKAGPLQSLAKSVAMGAGVNVGSTALQNVAAQQTYDPRRRVADGLLEAGLLGAGVPAVIHGAQAGLDRIAPAVPPPVPPPPVPQNFQGNGARAAGPETAGTGAAEIPVRPDPAPELSSAPPEPVRPGQESPVDAGSAAPAVPPQARTSAPTPEAANDTRPAAAEDLRSLGPALGARVVETQKPEIPVTGTQGVQEFQRLETPARTPDQPTSIQQKAWPENPTFEDVLAMRVARREEEIKLYQEQIGLSRSEAEKLQAVLERDGGTDKFAKKLGTEKEAALNKFFDESPLNKVGSSFEMWNYDRRFNPEELVGESNKISLGRSLAAVLYGRDVAPERNSDQYVFAVAALRRLKELGATKEDIARAADIYTTNISGSQGDKAESFVAVGNKIGEFARQHGVEFPDTQKPELPATGNQGVKQFQRLETPAQPEAAAQRPDLGVPSRPSVEPPAPQPEAPAYKPPRIARADQPVVDAVLDPQSRAQVKDLSKLPTRTLNHLARELGLEAKARSRKALVSEIHAAQPVATAGRYVMARTDMDGIVQKHGLRGPLEDLQKEVASIASAIRRNALEFGKTPRKVGDQNSAGQYDEVIWENRGRVYPPGMNKDTVPALQRFLAGEPMSGKQLAHVQRAINHLTRDWPKEAWEGVARPDEFPSPRASEEVFREYVAEGRVLPHDADVWLDLNAKTEAINSRGESIDVPVNDNTYRIVTHIPVRDEAGNVTGFDYLVTDDNKTFLRVGEDAILKGEADETTLQTFFDQFTQPPRASEADAGAPAAVQRHAGEVPQSGGPGERSLRPGNRGDEPETLTLQSETRDQRAAREKAAADKAEIARRQNERKTGNAGDLGTGDMFDKTAGENALFTQQNALPRPDYLRQLQRTGVAERPDGSTVRVLASNVIEGMYDVIETVDGRRVIVSDVVNPLTMQAAQEFAAKHAGGSVESIPAVSDVVTPVAAPSTKPKGMTVEEGKAYLSRPGQIMGYDADAFMAMQHKAGGKRAPVTVRNGDTGKVADMSRERYVENEVRRWGITPEEAGRDFDFLALERRLSSVEKQAYGTSKQMAEADALYPEIVAKQDEMSDADWKKIHASDVWYGARNRWLEKQSQLPTTGTQRPADFQQVEPAKPSASELRDAAQKKADVAELYSGIPFLNAVPQRARALAANDLPEQPGPLQSNDPAVERRWQAAKLKPTPLRDKLTNAARAVKNSFTRHFPDLDRVRHAPEIEILRQHEAAPQLAQMKAAEEIHAIAGNLGPKKFGVFERLVILPDLLRDIDRGLHEGKELPFGYASRNAVAADLHKFEQIAARNPDLKRAVEQRRVMMNAVRDEMVSRDLLPEGVKDFDDYFHRQVMVHRAMQEASGPGTSAGEVRNQTKGFQRARTGSSKDYNTSYLESEFEVLSQMYAQMATQDTLGRLNRTSNIAPQLREAARAQGVEDWRTLVPEGYTLWQPERGNHFHWGNTLTDRVVEQFLRGEKMLEEGDFKKALVMGQAKDQWAIPKELAKTLDNFGPRPDTLVEKFVAAGIGGWKVWTLLNPLRAAGYNLSNAVGDADVVMAYDPKIFTYAPQAVRDLKKWVINKDKATPEIEDAVRRGNLSSSFTVAELPDVSQSVLFSLLKGEKPGLVKQYWSSVKDYTRWREEVLRLAALRYFKDEQRAGRIRYGASERADVDALRATMPDEVPYKLARELIGDYGNVSQAGQWLRSHLIPFYSWMEINAPRYVRMFKNLPGEGRGTGDVVKVLGAKTAGKAALYTARAAGLYMMLNLWNKTMFPEEERELDIGGRRQLHLILGRREDGTIRTIRMAGALSDALSWGGAEDFPSDVSDVAEGRASVGDKIIEAAKAPVNRVINASSPIKKTVAESLMGATMYPDAFNPRPIRDKAEHIAGLMSAKPIYRYLADRPGPKTDGADKLLSLVTYTTDPGEAAYNVARTIAQEWLEKNARESNPGEPTARQNALYYYKQAVKYKDDRLAQKYWADYVRLGGNTKAAGQSIARAAPAASVPTAYRGAFMQSLTPREREIMSTAEAWYRKTYKP